MALVENIQRHDLDSQKLHFPTNDWLTNSIDKSKWVNVLEKAFYNCELFKTFKLDPIIQT
jgi:hypothetical protein